MTPTRPIGALSVEPRSWRIGRYTVQLRPRFDSPYWPQYVVLVGDRIIGKQLSWPSESDCAWLERQAGPRLVYVEERTRLTSWSDGRRKRRVEAIAEEEGEEMAAA